MTADDTMGLGSATCLKGLVSTLSLFVDCGGLVWTKDEKQHLLRSERAAERWLVGQAARYGVDLGFRRGGTYGFDAAIPVQPLPLCAGDNLDIAGLLRRALAAVGLTDPLHAYRSILHSSGAHAVHAVVYLNAAGRSRAAPYYSGQRMARFMEACVVYRAHLAGARKGPSSIAHEILHLYGAWDLYPSRYLTAAQAALAAGAFPNDIMLHQPRDIYTADIGPLTAWRIGWVPPGEWHEFMRPGAR